MIKKISIAIFFSILFLSIGVILYKSNIYPKIKSELKQIIHEPTNSVTGHEIKSKASIYGIDISHHQGNINWTNQLKWQNHKINFVYIKATEGSTYVDKKYKYNFEGAKKNGLLVGSYHYFRTSSSIRSQFKNLIANVSVSDQNLIPLIDVEEMNNWSSREFHNNFQEFLNLVEAHFGVKPMIYTVNSFYNRHLANKYREYHFLIGRYGKNSPNMRDKSNWSIWQFSETGQVNGINKKVDIDVLNPLYAIDDILMKN